MYKKYETRYHNILALHYSLALFIQFLVYCVCKLTSKAVVHYMFEIFQLKLIIGFIAMNEQMSFHNQHYTYIHTPLFHYTVSILLAFTHSWLCQPLINDGKHAVRSLQKFSARSFHMKVK